MQQFSELKNKIKEERRDENDGATLPRPPISICQYPPFPSRDSSLFPRAQTVLRVSLTLPTPMRYCARSVPSCTMSGFWPVRVFRYCMIVLCVAFNRLLSARRIDGNAGTTNTHARIDWASHQTAPRPVATPANASASFPGHTSVSGPRPFAVLSASPQRRCGPAWSSCSRSRVGRRRPSRRVIR